MKKYIVIPFAFILQISFSQNTFPTNGNAGIGTLDPISKLTIIGSLTVNGGLNNASSRPPISSGTLINGEIRGYSNGWNSADDGFLRLSAGGGTNPIKTYIDLSAYSTVPDMMGNIVFGTYGYERMRIDSNGNIGIGNTNPAVKLDVFGTISSYEPIALGATINSFQLIDQRSGNVGENTIINRLWTYRDGNQNNWYTSRLHDGISVDVSFQTPNVDTKTWWERDPLDNIQSWGNNSETYLTINKGNVGIGQTNPTNKLDVNGTIHSKEVKVDMTGWSDFVFKKEYKLPTLEEVEKHIAEKGHLENIPNEKEVLENGISLGEMNSKLLQKIEELTLYMIEMKKENTLLRNNQIEFQNTILELINTKQK
ncbi:hypothetical protein [Flavobacterium tyrosinilyticum]|uniref:hypothetical protein n=1 Tax=Flavobacterium tyrosinilyticum TaxID=1658740 RepID=UPI00202DC9EF|nr:hypothetical protein [Flavobacterium tyrosinilyticum]MCM0666900.1 hypothetical protein [Flavobacterium tyrosinilyticum]